MKIKLVPTEEISVEIQEVTLIFRSAVEQDTPIASLIIEQANGAIGKIDRSVATKHVFGALKEIKGEITVEDGEPLTVDKLKSLSQEGKIQAAFSNLILIPWAVKILSAQGFFDKAPTKAQKEESLQDS